MAIAMPITNLLELKTLSQQAISKSDDTIRAYFLAQMKEDWKRRAGTYQ